MRKLHIIELRTGGEDQVNADFHRQVSARIAPDSEIYFLSAVTTERGVLVFISELPATGQAARERRERGEATNAKG